MKLIFFFNICLTLQVGFTTYSYIPGVLYMSVLCNITTYHIATPSKYNHDTLAECSTDHLPFSSALPDMKCEAHYAAIAILPLVL